MICSYRGVGAFCVVALSVSLCYGAADEPQAQRLALSEALETASARSPFIQQRRALVAAAEARLVTARTYPHDPTISVEGARRKASGGTELDREIRISQVVQIGGQRGRRVAQATSELDAARSGLLRGERLLGARVSAMFVEALRMRELGEVERANVELTRSLTDVAQKRFEAGSVAQMEVNLAQVQLGRAERDYRLALGAYEVARVALAQTVGLDPADPVEPDGEFAVPERATAGLSGLVAGALGRRKDLASFRETVEAARARIEVARREVVPNLTVGAFYGREDGTDRLSGGTIGVRIPIFNRNQGGIVEARAMERQAVADFDAAELRARQEVVAARARYRASAEAVHGLEVRVLGTLDDNLRLLQRSFESGKTGWTEVLVFRREFVEIQREYIETVADAWLSSIELDLAAGHPFSRTDKESQR